MCFTSSLLLLIQVQLPAKLVGKINSFFQYRTPELYTYPTFVLKKKKQETDDFVSLRGRGPKLLSRNADYGPILESHTCGYTDPN